MKPLDNNMHWLDLTQTSPYSLLICLKMVLLPESPAPATHCNTWQSETPFVNTLLITHPTTKSWSFLHWAYNLFDFRDQFACLSQWLTAPHCSDWRHTLPYSGGDKTEAQLIMKSSCLSSLQNKIWFGCGVQHNKIHLIKRRVGDIATKVHSE